MFYDKFTIEHFFLLMHVQAPCDGVQIVQIAVLPLFKSRLRGEGCCERLETGWTLIVSEAPEAGQTGVTS